MQAYMKHTMQNHIFVLFKSLLARSNKYISNSYLLFNRFRRSPMGLFSKTEGILKSLCVRNPDVVFYGHQIHFCRLFGQSSGETRSSKKHIEKSTAPNIIYTVGLTKIARSLTLFSGPQTPRPLYIIRTGPQLRRICRRSHAQLLNK